MTMLYAVVLSVTSLARTHAVEPLGRCARRTCTQPGRVPMTGKVERAPNQVAGTRPAALPSGLGYRGAAPRSVASSAGPGEIGAGPRCGAMWAEGARGGARPRAPGQDTPH